VKKVALICGEGELPSFLYQSLRKKKVDLVCIGIKEFLNPNFRFEYQVKLGEINHLVKILRKERVEEIIFSGRIDKKRILSYSDWDEVAKGLLKKAKKKGSRALLELLKDFLESKGFILPDLTPYLKPWIPEEGVLTLRKPTPEEWEDIHLGWRIGSKLSQLDVGHTVVVYKGMVLALEGIEGTDETIKRAGKLCKGGVVVKAPRPGEDFRMDPPVVGMDTLRVMEEAGIKTLALGAGKSLILQKEKFLNQANFKGFSIVSLP